MTKPVNVYLVLYNNKTTRRYGEKENFPTQVHVPPRAVFIQKNLKNLKNKKQKTKINTPHPFRQIIGIISELEKRFN